MLQLVFLSKNDETTRTYFVSYDRTEVQNRLLQTSQKESRLFARLLAGCELRVEYGPVRWAVSKHDQECPKRTVHSTYVQFVNEINRLNAALSLQQKQQQQQLLQQQQQKRAIFDVGTSGIIAGKEFAVVKRSLSTEEEEPIDNPSCSGEPTIDVVGLGGDQMQPLAPIDLQPGTSDKGTVSNLKKPVNLN